MNGRWLRASAVVGLVLLGAMVPPASSQAPCGGTPAPPATPAPDLKPVALRVLDPQPNWTYDQVNDTTVQIEVRNNGDLATEYQIIYEWWNGTRTFPLNEDENSSLDVADPLCPGAKRTHTAPWRIQSNQVGHGAIRVRLETAGAPERDRNVTDNVGQWPVFIPRRAMEFSIPGAARNITPGETRFFRPVITNTGNVALNATLRVLEPDLGVHARINESLDTGPLTVAPGRNVTLPLYLEYLLAGDYQPFVTTYIVEAYPGFGPRLRATTPAINGTTGAWNASRYDYALHSSRAGAFFLAPGSLAETSVRLTNVGLEEDTYRIQAAMDNGWAHGLSENRFALRAGESASFNVTFGPPANAPSGAYANLTVFAASDHGAERPSIEFPLRVTGPSVRIERILLWQDDAYKGDSPSALVKFDNDGDGASANGSRLQVKLEVPGQPLRVIERSLEPLAPRASSSLLVPLGVLASGGAATLSASWAPQAGAPFSTSASHSFVVRDPSIAVLPPPVLSGVPGEAVPYQAPPNHFRVKNLGGVTETLKLSAEAGRGRAILDGDGVLVLEPGQTRAVTLTHRLPLPAGDAVKDTVTLTARVSVRPTIAWNSTVQTSIIDRSPPRLALAGAPQVWALGQPLRIDVLAADDGGVAAVNATVTGPAQVPKVLLLVPGVDAGRWAAAFTPEIPGNYSVEIRGTDLAGNRASGPTFRFEARAVAPPVIRLQGPLPGAHVAPSQVIQVYVEDELGVEALWVKTRTAGAADWTTETLELVDGSAAFPLPNVSAGPLDLLFEAVNAAGARGNLSLALVMVEPSTASPNETTPTEDGPTIPGPAAVLTPVLTLGIIAWGRRRTRGGPGAGP